MITLGVFNLHLYGLMLGIGSVIIYTQLSKRYHNQLKTVDYIVLGASTLVGAKLVYLLHNIEQISSIDALLDHLSRNGFVLYGAIYGLLLSLIIIGSVRKITVPQLSDHVFLYMPIAQAIGRLGNYFNQELYGVPTNLPIGIYIRPENRLPGFEDFSFFHPVFAYEALLNLVNFLILYRVSGRFREGVVTAMYLINYGIIRLLLNRLRIDKEYLLGIETSDLFSIISIFIGAIVLYRVYCPRFSDLKTS